MRLTAHPNEIPVETMDRLLDGEVQKFQHWIMSREMQKGLSPAALSAPERMAVKAYLMYAATVGEP